MLATNIEKAVARFCKVWCYVACRLCGLGADTEEKQKGVEAECSKKQGSGFHV